MLLFEPLKSAERPRTSPRVGLFPYTDQFTPNSSLPRFHDAPIDRTMRLDVNIDLEMLPWSPGPCLRTCESRASFAARVTHLARHLRFSQLYL